MLRLCRYARYGLVLALMLACAADGSKAESNIIRPRRLVHLFDFEEPDNYESLPQNWFIIGRTAETNDSSFFREPLHHDLMEMADYPSYNDVRFDRKHAYAGDRSLYLGLNGGSAGAYLEVGAIPVVPRSDYLITARVRTDKLVHDSAFLSAYFVDRHGERIDASVVTSKPIRTHAQWTPIAIKLQGDAKGAVWLGLQAEIRQPKRNKADLLGDQRIVLSDVNAEAWFDDIAVWQLPRIEVATQSKVNLIRAPQKPNIAVSIRDLTSQSLSADITVYNLDLRPVARQRRSLDSNVPRDWVWTPDLPAFGWYLIDLKVHDQTAQPSPTTKPVARTFGAFVWLPPTSQLSPIDNGRFKLIATGLPDEQLDFLPELLENTGIQDTTLSIWSRQTTPGNLEDRRQRVEALMHWLDLTGRSASLSLNPVPLALADAIHDSAADPFTLVASDRSQWIAYLTPTLLYSGQRVQRWQLGSIEQAYLFDDPKLPQSLDNIQQQFVKLVASPELLIPWRLDQQRRSDLPSSTFYLMDTPPGIVADRLPDYLADWGDVRNQLTLVLREPPADQLAQHRRATDLALRMLHAWQAQPGAIAVEHLWTRAAQHDLALVPDPLLGVFANMAHQLAGRRVIDKLSLAEGVHVWILDGPAGPALAAWSDMPGTPDSRLNLYLGQHPKVTDLWGNTTALPASAGKHPITLTDSPVFITDIDVELALFRAGFKIDQPFIESTQTLHERVFTLTNPWATTITGHMTITEPDGWTTKPTRQFFSIPAGRTISLPFALSFPISEVAGPHKLTAHFDFNASRPIVVDMSLPIEVGLHDVKLDATVAVTHNPDTHAEDATAIAIVTNTGDKPLNLYVFANLRGKPIQERIVAELDPGQSIVRHFTFPNAGQTLRDTPMRLGVREIEGQRILNKRISLSNDD